MMVTIALAAGTASARAPAAPSQPGAGAGTGPSVTIGWLPRGTSLERLRAAGLAVGLMSAGLGEVPAAQTELDISQGNRVFDSLYDGDLPRRPRGGACGPPYSAAVRERARSAPADVVPGLLAATLGAAGRRCRAVPLDPASLRAAARRLRGDDLLIAIERPPPGAGEALSIGIAGRGYDGVLTSDSTRIDGYVLSTDVAPTILARHGLAPPAAMTGEPIRAVAGADPGSVAALGERLSAISERRGPVIGLALGAWLLALAAAALLRRAAPAATRLAALSVVLLPLVLLGAAALEPGQGAEAALALVAPPLLAAGLLAALGGYRALAVASGATVAATAVDVLAGSPLTSLSLLGPNPGLGARFYGIGNELEATLAVLVVAGTGAALAGFRPRARPKRAAVAFLVAGGAAAAVFAPGRFGADVGAAIVFPFGAAVAAAAIVGGRRRALLAIALAPLLGLSALVLADLLSGGDAHLTRSVLEAGGLGEAADVAQRRLELSARSFTRPVVFVFMPLIALAAALAVARRRRIAAWLEGRPAARAGLLGALAAVLIGALANDSGALLLEIGAVYLLAFVGFAWAEGGRRATAAPPA